MFTIYPWRKARQKDRLQICLKTVYNDKGVYAARYIKYRGLRKWAVWSLGYWRSFLIGINSFFSRDITSYWSFSVVRRRKTLQILAAIVKLTLYSCFAPCFSSTVWFIIVSVMLYASSLAHISCFTYSGLYAWKLLSPMVYFSFLNEDSIFHLALYKVLIRSAGNSSRGNRKQLPDPQSVCNLLCGCLPKLFSNGFGPVWLWHQYRRIPYLEN